MFVNFQSALRWAGIVVLALAIWLLWWSRPERQIRRAQTRLLAAVEARDYPALSRLLAEDYSDCWENDKAIVLSRSPQVFDQFLTLNIEGPIEVLDLDEGIVQQKMKVSGLGGPLAMYARDRINELRQPFTLKWRKISWREWELVSVEQPELKLPRE